MNQPDPDTDPRVAEHRRRYRDLLAQLSDIGFISRGSVTQRYTSCGKPSCRCQADPPQPHGPYWQWTRKINGKTHTRRLTETEAALYQRLIANARRLEHLIAEMEDISRDATATLLNPPPDSD